MSRLIKVVPAILTEDAVAFSKMVQSQSGRIVHDETTYFDDPGHAFPDDLNHFYSIPMSLRGLNFAPGAQEDLQIWFSGHLTPWKMDVLVEGEDLVKVPAGVFHCWKVRVDFDLKAIFKRWYCVEAVQIGSLVNSVLLMRNFLVQGLPGLPSSTRRWTSCSLVVFRRLLNGTPRGDTSLR